MEYNGTDIKYCPFCGYWAPIIIEGVISIDAKRFDKSAKICCPNCGAQIIKQITGEAVEAWNRRTLKIDSAFYHKPLNFNMNELEKALTHDNSVQAAIARVIKCVMERGENDGEIRAGESQRR